MRKQRGFINITTADLVVFFLLIALLGWMVGHFLEWIWPYVKAFIHGATAP